jgi:pimeloyl-ACP methyl ester carboxylesterase
LGYEPTRYEAALEADKDRLTRELAEARELLREARDCIPGNHTFMLRRIDADAEVSERGGPWQPLRQRSDLAGPWLEKVQAPTLLIVGGHDYAVIDLNREAQRHLHCTSLLEVVRGATHLFEEPGALAQVARLAQSWFLAHLA